MSEFIIRGANPLRGEIQVQGSKNGILPILAASILVGGETLLHNCPQISDVACALEILHALGCKAERRGGDIYIDSRTLNSYEIPDRLMKKMRSSVIFAGAMLGRTGNVRISSPGGCFLGERPIDYHIHALRALGVDMEYDGEHYLCRALKLRGAQISLPFPSVGATENAILAACTAEGSSIIYNAAREPEIVDLADFLHRAGFEVNGAGGPTVIVSGGRSCGFVEYTVRGDRIAAGTLLCAAAASGGEITVRGIDSVRVSQLSHRLAEAGYAVRSWADAVRVGADGRPEAIAPVETHPYPGFSTDLQPPLMALMCFAKGESIFIENIFESRYNHIESLLRMGARIQAFDRIAHVHGVPALHGAHVDAGDLRAGAALITAALGAQGETRISDRGYIDRGYERIEQVLASLGAEITRVNDDNFGA